MTASMKIHNSTVRLVKGDITELEVQAFVFYAQHDLQLGSGYGNVITLRLTLVGKNPKSRSPGSLFGLDCVVLE